PSTVSQDDQCLSPLPSSHESLAAERSRRRSWTLITSLPHAPIARPTYASPLPALPPESQRLRGGSCLHHEHRGRMAEYVDADSLDPRHLKCWEPDLPAEVRVSERAP